MLAPVLGMISHVRARWFSGVATFVSLGCSPQTDANSTCGEHCGGAPTALSGGAGGEHAATIGGTTLGSSGGAVTSPTASGGVIAKGGAASGGLNSGGAAEAYGGTTSGGVGNVGIGGMVALYSLVVDAPRSGDAVSGAVIVRGAAPGYKNVEVWDATHQKPPLGQVAPTTAGTFSLSVDTSTLPDGPITWTVWAWDTAPGLPANRSTSVQLSVIVANSTPGAGGATGSGGKTAASGGAHNGGTPSTSSGGVFPTGGASGASIETVGSGSIDSPAAGPAPTEAGRIGGAAFTLVKNWNFGAKGTIRNITDLSAEFMYHDQFGTIGNGSNYGAITVAPSAATAISGQPVEDPSRPYREFTDDVMQAYVRPLSTTQSTVSASSHNAGNGSVTAKWTLPSGGQLLGKDLLWETRARMPVAAAAYWFAIWTAGNKWDKGAEMDVLESFGTPNIYPPPTAFHVNSVGGTDSVDYSSWPNGLSKAGVPTNQRDLREWHTWTWLYRKDDTYVVYYDGIVVQSGSLHWTLGGTTSGENINMSFLFDFGWGHTKVADVNISLPADTFGITYEVDYSRVYLR